MTGQSQLNVLQICHSYYPPFLDCARQYAVLFAGTDYKVTTVYLTGERDEAVIAGSASDEVIFLGFKSSEVAGLKLPAILKVRKIAQAKQYTFCIAHRAKPTYVALLASKLKVISVRHNYGDFGRFSRRIMVNLFKKRLLILGVSNSVRDEIRQHLPDWPHDKIQTLYNRIDIVATQAQLISREDARAHLALPEGAWILGSAGRLHHDKDFPTLLRGFAAALPKLPKNSLLAIMGKGLLENELIALSQKLGIREHVKFLGHVPNGARYFKAFDAFALTSDHEPFGMVLLEAMAAEVPVLCSECGGGAEVVKEAGLLFKLGDANNLALSLLGLRHSNSQGVSNALNKLYRSFSDEAAKTVFWKIVQEAIIKK